MGLGLRIRVMKVGMGTGGRFVEYVVGEFTYRLSLLLLWKYTFIQLSELDCNKNGPVVEK